MTQQAFITGFLLIGLFISCKSKEPDCSKFRTGKFRYHGSVTNQNYVVERNDSIQTESVKETGTVMKFRINWIDACSYDLRFMGIETVGADSSILKREFSTISTTIVAVGEDYYVYRTRVNVAGGENSDTMWVFR